MVMLTGLARVAKKTGYPVVEVEGWKTRGHGQMGRINVIVCHHTAGPTAGGNYPSMSTVKSGRPGLPGPLSQYGIGRDGTIYVIAAGLSWHTGKVLDANWSNPHAIGIEAENNGLGQEWPAAQVDSYVKLCRALIDEFDLDEKDVRGHREICSPPGRKPDPFFKDPKISMTEFRGLVKKGSYSVVKPSAKPKPPAPKPPVKPSTPKPPTKKQYPHVAIATKGDKTAEWDHAWKYLMKAVDYTDDSLTVNIQEWLRDLIDPQTGKPYYGKHLRIDDIFGVETVKALQNKLYDTKVDGKRLYTGKIDGKRGSMTIVAEQKYLNSQRQYLIKK